MIALDPALVVSVVAPEDDLAPRPPSPAWPVAPAKTAFDASLEPLLQELEAAEANTGGVEDDEEPVAPPSEDEDSSFASIAQIWDSFMTACARPEELPREAKTGEAGTPKAKAHEEARGGGEVALAIPPPSSLGDDVRSAIDATDVETIDGAPAAPLEPPAPSELEQRQEAPASRSRAKPASEAAPRERARVIEAPAPPGPSLSRVKPAPREHAEPSPQDVPAHPRGQAAPSHAVEKAMPASLRPIATVAQGDADVGRSPPVAERLSTSDREAAIPVAGELVPPAGVVDVGPPTGAARIPSGVMDLTSSPEQAGDATARAVRAAESAGHRRALAAEARGKIVAPELGPVEVVARMEADARVAVVVRAEEQQGRDAIAAARPELVAHVRAEVPRADVHVEGAASPSAGASAGEGRDGGREAPPREPPEESRSPSFAPAARRPRARFVL